MEGGWAFCYFIISYLWSFDHFVPDIFRIRIIDSLVIWLQYIVASRRRSVRIYLALISGHNLSFLSADKNEITHLYIHFLWALNPCLFAARLILNRQEGEVHLEQRKQDQHQGNEYQTVLLCLFVSSIIPPSIFAFLQVEFAVSVTPLSLIFEPYLHSFSPSLLSFLAQIHISFPPSILVHPARVFIFAHPTAECLTRWKKLGVKRLRCCQLGSLSLFPALTFWQ